MERRQCVGIAIVDKIDNPTQVVLFRYTQEEAGVIGMSPWQPYLKALGGGDPVEQAQDMTQRIIYKKHARHEYFELGAIEDDDVAIAGIIMALPKVQFEAVANDCSLLRAQIFSVADALASAQRSGCIWLAEFMSRLAMYSYARSAPACA